MPFTFGQQKLGKSKFNKSHGQKKAKKTAPEPKVSTGMDVDEEELVETEKMMDTMIDETEATDNTILQDMLDEEAASEPEDDAEDAVVVDDEEETKTEELQKPKFKTEAEISAELEGKTNVIRLYPIAANKTEADILNLVKKTINTAPKNMLLIPPRKPFSLIRSSKVYNGRLVHIELPSAKHAIQMHKAIHEQKCEELGGFTMKCLFINFEFKFAALVGETQWVLVKNIAHSVTEDDLEAFFTKHAQSTPTQIVLYQNSDESFAGYARIGFESNEIAANVVKSLCWKPFKGRQLYMSCARHDQKEYENPGGEMSKDTTKYMRITNLPGSITQLDLVTLVSTYGQFETCKMLKDNYGYPQRRVILSFDDVKTTTAVVKGLHNFELKGFKLSTAWQKSPSEMKKKGKNNKGAAAAKAVLKRGNKKTEMKPSNKKVGSLKQSPNRTERKIADGARGGNRGGRGGYRGRGGGRTQQSRGGRGGRGRGRGGGRGRGRGRGRGGMPKKFF